MKGDFPRFKAVYQPEELVEYFLLQDDESGFIRSFRGDVNRNTVTVLLKSLLYLGYFPESLEQISQSVRDFIASQLNLLWDQTPHYHWASSSNDLHLSQIRTFTG
jgi:hypothetical protein